MTKYCKQCGNNKTWHSVYNKLRRRNYCKHGWGYINYFADHEFEEGSNSDIIRLYPSKRRELKK